MDMQKLYTEARPGLGRAGDTERNGTHREFPSDNSNFVSANKWGKENLKFFGDFGSPQYIPCTKSEEQLSQVMQYKQDPNPRKIRNS